MNPRIVGGALVVIVAVVVAWWLSRGPSDVASDPSDESSAAGSSSSSETGSLGSASGAGSEMQDRRADGGTDAAEAPAPAPRANEPVDPERAAADAYRRRIQEALQDDIAEAGQENRDFDGRLGREFIRAAVQEIRPLIAECYDMVIEASEAAGEDVPEGQLVAEFTFVGAEGEGGIVETSTIDENSEPYHPALDECVSETLYTLELPAPEEGGRIMVRYPFRFSQAPPEEEPAP